MIVFSRGNFLRSFLFAQDFGSFLSIFFPLKILWACLDHWDYREVGLQKQRGQHIETYGEYNCFSYCCYQTDCETTAMVQRGTKKLCLGQQTPGIFLLLNDLKVNCRG